MKCAVDYVQFHPHPGPLPQETVSQVIFVSFRSEARNLGFNKFSTLRFLTEPALSRILQSLRSFRMTERRVRNDIFSDYDTVSPGRVFRLYLPLPLGRIEVRGHYVVIFML